MLKIMIKFLIGSLLPVSIFGLVNLSFNRDTKQARAPVVVSSEKTSQVKSKENLDKPPPPVEKPPEPPQQPQIQESPPVYVTDTLPPTGENGDKRPIVIGVLLFAIGIVKGKKEWLRK